MKKEIRFFTSTLLVAIVIVVTSCSISHHTSVYRLYFGMKIGTTNEISETEFRDFLDTAITRRFPNGFTVYNTYGQWRSGDITIHEPSRVLEIADTAGKEIDRKIAEVRASYKKTFHQESVMLTIQKAKVEL